jgi:hypothetical protein
VRTPAGERFRKFKSVVRKKAFARNKAKRKAEL